VRHKVGDDVRYFYAEPQHCVCIFVGNRAGLSDLPHILNQPPDQPDTVSPDYKTQAGALLSGQPVWLNTLNDPSSLADYFRTYY